MINVLTVYYCLVFLLIISSCLIKTDAKLVSVMTYIIVALYFSVLLSNRDVYSINDAVIYMEYFNEYSDFSSIFTGSYAWKGDYFFFFLGYLFKLFSNDSELYIRTFYFFNTLFYFVLSALLLNRVKVYNYLFFVVFVIVSSSFFFLYGNVIRQGLAFNLFLMFILVYSSNHGYLRFIIAPLILIAAIFSHKAIIVLIIPVYIVNYMGRWSKTKLLLIGTASAFLLSSFYQFFLTLIGGGAIFHKLMVYKEAEGSSNVVFKFFITLVFLLLTTILVKHLQVYFQKQKLLDQIRAKEIKIIEITYYASLFNFFVSILTIPFGKIATRFLLYTDSLLVIMLPMIIMLIFRYKQRITGLRFNTIAFFVCVMVIPYSFLFFQHDGIVSVLGENVFLGIFRY